MVRPGGEGEGGRTSSNSLLIRFFGERTIILGRWNDRAKDEDDAMRRALRLTTPTSWTTTASCSTGTAATTSWRQCMLPDLACEQANTPAERATVRKQIATYADDDPDIELELMSMLGVAR
jgi:hypothetical protein